MQVGAVSLVITSYSIHYTKLYDNDLATNFNAKITIPHHADAVEGVDRVIYSAAVRPNNPEYQKAKELGIELLSRKEALKSILGEKEVYAVGGAHGKSTTSAMLASIIPHSNALIGAISSYNFV